MRADHEDVQEVEASDIYVKRFKSPEVFVTKECEIPCANGILRLANRPRLSSTVEKTSCRHGFAPRSVGDRTRCTTPWLLQACCGHAGTVANATSAFSVRFLVVFLFVPCRVMIWT